MRKTLGVDIDEAIEAEEEITDEEPPEDDDDDEEEEEDDEDETEEDAPVDEEPRDELQISTTNLETLISKCDTFKLKTDSNSVSTFTEWHFSGLCDFYRIQYLSPFYLLCN